MSQTSNTAIAVIGIDIGKKLVPRRGPTMRAAPSCCGKKWSRGPSGSAARQCTALGLIGMEGLRRRT